MHRERSAVSQEKTAKETKKRKTWTREWLGNRTTFGAHYTLLAGGTQKVNLDVATNRDLLVVPSIKYDNHCQHVIFYVSVFVKRHLVERNRARLYSVQQRSTC